MNKKFILGGIVVSALALAPIGIKNIIDTTIDLQKSNLDNKGILLSIDKSEGYLNTNRDFTLTIKDEVRFKEHFTNVLIEKYPIYELFINSLIQKDSKKFDEFLRGVVFKGNIKNSNINLSSDIEVYTYLDKFSDEMMAEIKNDEEASKLILPLFEEEVFAFDILFDNKAKLKTLSLKDIDQNIKSTSKSGRTEEITFQVLESKLINSSTNKALIADVNLDKFNLEVKGTNSASFTLNNLKYNINYENQFIYNGDFEFKNIALKAINKNIQVGKTEVVASGLVTNDIYSAKSKFATSDLKFEDILLKTSLEKLDVDFNLGDINYKNIQKLNETYLAFEDAKFNSMNASKNERIAQVQTASEPFLHEINNLINKGVSLKVNAKVGGLKNQKLDLASVQLDVDAKLNENNLDISTLNRFGFLSSLDGKAKLQMEENDYLSLSKTIHPNIVRIISSYAKKENGNVLFNLEFNKGRINVNGKKVL